LVTICPRVSIIILNWNGFDYTLECVNSLKKITYPNYEITIVDNGSKGNEAKLLQEKLGAQAQFIFCERNFGFAGGVNIGLRHVLANSRPDYFLLLNNDTKVAPDFLDKLVQAAQTDPRIGIVGPRIYYYDYQGKDNIIWFAGGKIRWWSPWVYSHIGQGEPDSPAYDRVTDVAWISGAALMFKSELIVRIGLVNSTYFMGHEDVEYCMQARKCGFRVVFVPGAVIQHKVGASGRNSFFPILVDPWSYYRLIKRNFSLPVYIYHLCILPVLLTGGSLLYLIRYKNPRLVGRVLSNFFKFVFHIPGKTLDPGANNPA
jgi:GT2 family glycosyltransferase